MKYVAILLLSCLSVLGQSPLITASGIDWTKGTSFNPQNFGNLFIEILSDNSTSVTNVTDGQAILSIFNVAPGAPHFGNDNDRWNNPSAAAGFYRKTGGPIGQPTIDFNNGGAVVLYRSQVQWNTNQPMTVFFVLKKVNSGTTSFCDANLGGRIIVQSTATASSIFAGTGFAQNTVEDLTHWMVWSAVFNTTSSYYRTNGVLIASGSAGANSMGQLQLGNDITQATQFKGLMCACLAYGQAMNTNDLQAVEAGLRARYGF